MKKAYLMLASAFTCLSLFAQTDSTTANSFIDMNLEDLMDVKIVSASKKSESVFDAPLSASSLSREEIKKAGATSIMEALRLVPGIIVRENSNGNYDVFIRGFENLPPGTVLNNATNTISLVMIDNRPVYNYFNGGTFWETLPIDLNDVEKIEVIRGPSSALYGPNAANGVINIITRRASKEGLYTVANAQGGTSNTYVGNASMGYKKGKLDFIVSGNFQSRKRTDNNYYSWVLDRKVPADSVVTSFPGAPLTDVHGTPNSSDRYPNSSNSLGKFGYNGFVNYTWNDKASMGISLGGQQSTALVSFVENLATPLSVRTSNTNYADVHAKVYGLTAQLSYQGGTQDASKGQSGYKYNFGTVDALLEYDLKWKDFSLKPGVGLRNAVYDDSKYANIQNQEGFLNGARTLANASGWLRAEYDNKKMIKLIAAVRLDKYNYPKDVYASYQFAGNLKINDRNLVRAVYSRAYRGPTMYDTYSSQALYVGDDSYSGIPVHLFATYFGADNLKLQKIDMFELGYRLKATDYLHFDLEAFYQISSNYSQLVAGQQSPPSVAPDFSSATAIIPQRIQNINMTAEQTGFTLSANFLYKKFQFKPFVTIQQTFLHNVPTVRDSANINITTSYDGSNSSSPTYYGGAYLNYQATSKLNLNVSGSYYSAYNYSNIYYLLKKRDNGIVDISDKLILNARISYKLMDKLDLFVNARNLFNSKAQEFANTDMTKGVYMLGANFEF